MSPCGCFTLPGCPVHSREALDTPYLLAERLQRAMKEEQETTATLVRAALTLKAALQRQTDHAHDRRGIGTRTSEAAFQRSLQADVDGAAEALWALCHPTNATKCQMKGGGDVETRSA